MAYLTHIIVEPSVRSPVLFITGPPGSGKSTLARACVAVDNNIHIIDSDDETTMLYASQHNMTLSQACAELAHDTGMRVLVTACFCPCGVPYIVIERNITQRVIASPNAHWPLTLTGKRRAWAACPALVWSPPAHAPLLRLCWSSDDELARTVQAVIAALT